MGGVAESVQARPTLSLSALFGMAHDVQFLTWVSPKGHTGVFAANIGADGSVTAPSDSGKVAESEVCSSASFSGLSVYPS